LKLLIAMCGAALLLARGAAADAGDGADVYKKNCAKCHGDTGGADTAAAKAMKVPPLKGDANVQKMSVADIAARIMENKKHPQPVKSLSADDVNAAAAYVKQLAGGK
jgi:mono/diheme cytochrome c family protein